MALTEYKRKRDFAKTPEPAAAVTRGKPRGKKSPRYFIQRHDASKLHYDFRLEVNGVLKSWAIPRGPSLDPKVKRLAVKVEDHPLDYGDFEGTIPEGNYGAGDVVLWDRGTYDICHGKSVDSELARGALKFELHGKKLHGAFALVHIKSHDEKDDDNSWLLIKEPDGDADAAWEIEAHPESVRAAKVRRAEPIPAVRRPMLATLVGAPFDREGWLFEIKWDGYRAIATIDRSGTPTLISRNGQDLLAKLPEFAEIANAFSEHPIVVDGEICVLDARGRSSFTALQHRLDRYGRVRQDGPTATYVVFDLLYAGGRDLRTDPLLRRKETLKSLLTGNGSVLYSEHVVARGREFFAAAMEQSLEGIIAKRCDSPYIERRSTDWQKIKIQQRQEVVIGGWTEPRGARSGFGALLAGVYDDGKLVPAGSIGTGFDVETLGRLSERLRKIERKTSPFATPPKTQARAHFVEPKLVAEVRFTEWTRDGSMRHPVFLGLRTDKDPRTITRETPSRV